MKPRDKKAIVLICFVDRLKVAIKIKELQRIWTSQIRFLLRKLHSNIVGVKSTPGSRF